MRTEDYIKTGNEITDAISNVEKLVRANEAFLELRNIYNYDELYQIDTPSVAITFESATPEIRQLGHGLGENANRGCTILNVNLTLYLYLFALSLGDQEYEHIARLGNLTKILFNNSILYGLCTDGMKVVRALKTGRRVGDEIYLTGQIDLIIPVRM